MIARKAIFLLLLSLPVLCQAEVLTVAPGGFEVRHALHTRSTPADAWSAMVSRVDQWWNGEHSWSGSAANLYIVPKVGGCFCEHLPQADGRGEAGVEHLRIVYLKPYEEIRFEGALGPLQTLPVDGRMLWQITAAESGSTITFTYLVHGFLAAGFDQLAPAVDGVIGEQLDRLGRLLEQPG
jgi:hypothetical protein